MNHRQHSPLYALIRIRAGRCRNEGDGNEPELGIKMKYTTLSEIKKFGPCKDRWEELLGGLNKTQADDEPLPYSKILEINGIADAIWSLRTNRKLAQAYAIACAEAVLPIFEKRRPGDDRPRQCIEAAKSYLVGDITIGVLRQRRAAADAADAAYAAYAYADAAARQDFKKKIFLEVAG